MHNSQLLWFRCLYINLHFCAPPFICIVLSYSPTSLSSTAFQRACWLWALIGQLPQPPTLTQTPEMSGFSSFFIEKFHLVEPRFKEKVYEFSDFFLIIKSFNVLISYLNLKKDKQRKLVIWARYWKDFIFHQKLLLLLSTNRIIFPPCWS